MHEPGVRLKGLAPLTSRANQILLAAFEQLQKHATMWYIQLQDLLWYCLVLFVIVVNVM